MIKQDKLRPILASLEGQSKGRIPLILKFHDEYASEILFAKGSGANHQNWEGGLHDHLHHCFVLATDLFGLFHKRIGFGPYQGQDINGVYDPRPIPFSLESAIVVLYFHDIEKIFKYGRNAYPESYLSNDLWYYDYLPNKYGISFDEQELNALKYAHGEGDDHRKDRRVASPLAGFVHSIDNLSARVLWQIKNFDYGFNKNEEKHLRNLCIRSVGKRVKYSGTNGDEYDKTNYGLYVEGEGRCLSQHDSHGLCVMIQHDDLSILCVDPVSIEILNDV